MRRPGCGVYVTKNTSQSAVLSQKGLAFGAKIRSAPDLDFFCRAFRVSVYAFWRCRTGGESHGVVDGHLREHLVHVDAGHLQTVHEGGGSSCR